jgi:hypothetical protein
VCCGYETIYSRPDLGNVPGPDPNSDANPYHIEHSLSLHFFLLQNHAFKCLNKQTKINADPCGPGSTRWANLVNQLPN